VIILKRKDLDKGTYRVVKLVTKYYVNCGKYADKRQRSPYNLPLIHRRGVEI
jgi:hypothetical protein